MAELASDTFDRANNTDLGTSWDVVPTHSNCQIVFNNVRASAATVDCTESYNGVTWPNDQYSEVSLAGITATARCGPAVRCSTSVASLYNVEADPGNIFLFKQVSGTWTTLGSFAGTIASTDVIRLEAQGTTIRVRQNGVQRISVTDSSLSSGRAGIHIYLDSGAPLNTGEIASWRGGDFAVAAASALFPRPPIMPLLVR